LVGSEPPVALATTKLAGRSALALVVFAQDVLGIQNFTRVHHSLQLSNEGVFLPIVGPPVIGLNAPDHGATKAPVVDELSLESDGVHVIKANPPRPIMDVGSKVAAINDGFPGMGGGARQPRQGVVVKRLEDFIISKESKFCPIFVWPKRHKG